MQGSHAESYAQVVRERVAELPVPERFRAPDVLISDGCVVEVARPTTARPTPVLTVGERLAVEGSRAVVQGLVAVEVARVHLDSAKRRVAERAGSWATGLLKTSAVVLVLGLLFSSAWLVFLGGLGLVGGTLGLRLRLAGAEAFRQHVYDADELAVSWVGRQAVVDALRWRAERADSEPTAGLVKARFSAPTVRDRLAHLGA
ncbi:hypothetical protein [Nonomuraea sp. NPDC049028]|uniref:hypothetical protein n=1 Tax=Nonomuraea sp. NPDC049028 TaxID=3364348 RepID=UPI003723DEF3